MASKDEQDDPVVASVPAWFQYDKEKGFHLLRFSTGGKDTRAILLSSAMLYAKHHKLELRYPVVTRYGDLKKRPSALRNEQCVTGIPLGGVNCLHYAIGYFRKDIFRISNLSRVMMMQPTCAHLNDEAEKGPLKGPTTSQSADSTKEREDGVKRASSAPKLEVVRVRFAPLKRKKIKAPSIWDTASESSDEETFSADKKWNLEVNCAGPKEMRSYPRKGGRNKGKRASKRRASARKSCNARKTVNSNMKKYKENMFRAKRLVMQVMRKKKIALFDEIRSSVPQRINDLAVLQALEEVAVLIRGLWVLRSEVIFEQKCNADKEPAAMRSQLMDARDFVLYAYTLKPILSIRLLDCSFLPLNLWRSVFDEISTMVRHKGWKLMREPDETFAQRFPAVAASQKRMWDSKIPRFFELFSNVTEDGRILSMEDQMSTVSSPDNTDEESARRDRPVRKDRFASAVSPLVALEENHGAKRMKEGQSAEAESERKTASSGSRSETMVGSPRTAANVQDKSGPSEILSACFKLHPLISLSSLRKALSSGMPIKEGHAEVTNDDIEQCVIGMGAVQLSKEEGGEKLFAVSKFGTWPEVRLLIVEMLQEKGKFTFNIFKKACTAKLAGNMPKDPELRALLQVGAELSSVNAEPPPRRPHFQEYCSCRRGTYYVKQESDLP